MKLMNRALFKLLPILCAIAAGPVARAQEPQIRGAGAAGPPHRGVVKPAAAKTAPGVASPRNQLSIGVVDFAKILEAYPRAIEQRQLLDALMTRRQAELDAFQKRAGEARGLRDNFKEGSNEWLNKDLELQLALRAIEGKRQIFQAELVSEREEFYVAMLEDMQRAVTMVAQDRQVGLVLRVHEDLLDGSIDNKARVFESRVVWYAAKEIDLTLAVIKLLQVPLPARPDGQASGERANDRAGERANDRAKDRAKDRANDGAGERARGGKDNGG